MARAKGTKNKQPLSSVQYVGTVYVHCTLYLLFSFQLTALMIQLGLLGLPAAYMYVL